MQAAMILAMATAGLTTYPGLGDNIMRGQPPQSTVPPGIKIEALVDRGPIVEMIVRCGVNTAIISYSKIEKLYCSPRMACSPALSDTLATSCGTPAR